jgi:hypothetical protein
MFTLINGIYILWKSHKTLKYNVYAKWVTSFNIRTRGPYLKRLILWRIDPLLRDDSVNDSRCYGAPAAYTCTVTSHNNIRGDIGGVFCRSAPRLYDSTDRVLLGEWVQCNWEFTRGVLKSEIISIAKIRYQETSWEEETLWRAVTKYRLVEIDWEDLVLSDL